MIVLYQFYLIFAFLIGFLPILGRFTGDFLTKAFTKYYAKHNPSYFDEINCSYNFPYFYFWFDIFNSPRSVLPKYHHSVPVVYIYGSKKPFSFHT